MCTADESRCPSARARWDTGSGDGVVKTPRLLAQWRVTDTKGDGRFFGYSHC